MNAALIISEIKEKATQSSLFDESWSIFLSGSALYKRQVAELVAGDVDLLIVMPNATRANLEAVEATLGGTLLGIDIEVDVRAGPIANIACAADRGRRILLQCNVVSSICQLSLATRLALHFGSVCVAGPPIDFLECRQDITHRDRRMWLRDLLIAQSIALSGQFPVWSWTDCARPRRVLRRFVAGSEEQYEKQFKYCHKNFASWAAAFALLEEHERCAHSKAIESAFNGSGSVEAALSAALFYEESCYRESHILTGQRADRIDRM